MRGLRRVFFSSLAVTTVAFACGEQIGTAPLPLEDAGVNETGGSVADDAAPAPGDAAAPLDAGDAGPRPDRCSACRSKHCDDDGGCHPLVFMTNDQYRGNMNIVDDGGTTGLQRADAICVREADAGPGTFTAWLSTNPSFPALARVTGFGTSARPMRLPSGARVGASYGAVAAAQALEHPIDETAAGQQYPAGTRVWTGTTAQGNATPKHCSLWTKGYTNSGAADDGTYGILGADAGAGWTVAELANCASLAHLYCFETGP